MMKVDVIKFLNKLLVVKLIRDAIIKQLALIQACNLNKVV
jgi:hypothetical protein